MRIAQVSVSGTAAGASNWHEIDFKASASCGDEKNTANCFPSWSKFRVTVNGGSGILAVGGQSLSCAGSSCQFEFSTNDSIDTGAPTAGIVPTQICKDDGALKADANMVGGWGKDDVGISGINFYEQKQGGAENLVQAAPGDSKTYFYSEWQYATGAMNVGDSYTFRAEVSDMAASSSSASFTTDIKPGHCCNGVKDGSEEDVDCGDPVARLRNISACLYGDMTAHANTGCIAQNRSSAAFPLRAVSVPPVRIPPASPILTAPGEILAILQNPMAQPAIS